MNNATDFLRISKTIEAKLHKPNEHMCTSIDLSMYHIYLVKFYF